MVSARMCTQCDAQVPWHSTPAGLLHAEPVPSSCKAWQPLQAPLSSHHATPRVLSCTKLTGACMHGACPEPSGLQQCSQRPHGRSCLKRLAPGPSDPQLAQHTELYAQNALTHTSTATPWAPD
eukprot:1153343-Pelagomonas_calceolata.AAC.13